MFAFLIAFTLGVGVMIVYPLLPEQILLLLLLSLALALLWRRRGRSIPVLLLGIGLLGFALGCIRVDIADRTFDDSVLTDFVGEEVELVGVVDREPLFRERTVQVYVDTGTDIVLVSADRATAVRYGDTVKVSGTLRVPESFITEYGREFQYQGYLRARGVEYRISFAELSVRERGQGNPFVQLLLTAKSWFVHQLNLIIPEPQVGLGKGLLLGIDGALGDDIEEDFRRTGIIHIVVLSGYNVMLVVAFLTFVLSFCLPFRWRIVCGFFGIVAFALVVGLSATVVRASIMASLVLFADLIGRRYDVLRALLIAGVAMIIVNPYLLIYDIGFQLSFMATLGLILIVPHFETRFASESAQRWKAKDFLFATIATQIAVLPLLVYHIGEISIVAVLVNLLVLPLVPAAMLLTFVTGMLAGVSLWLGSALGFFATLVLSLILAIASWFAALPFAALILPAIPAWAVFVLYAFMAWVLYVLQYRTHDELAGWTIETETAGPQSGPAATKNETPIFFR